MTFKSIIEIQWVLVVIQGDGLTKRGPVWPVVIITTR